MTAGPSPLDLARQDAHGALVDLERDYGAEYLAVVYFVQRREDGPIKIGAARGGLCARLASFYTASPDPVIVRCLIPGGQPLEHYFHRAHRARHAYAEWYRDPDAIVADALAFRKLHLAAYAATGDLDYAQRAAIAAHDPRARELAQLWRNGMRAREIAELAGTTPSEVHREVENLRALGFDLPHRRAYSSRGSSDDRSLRGTRDRARLLG